MSTSTSTILVAEEHEQPRQLGVATLVDHDRDPSVRPVLFKGEDPRADSGLRRVSSVLDNLPSI